MHFADDPDPCPRAGPLSRLGACESLWSGRGAEASATCAPESRSHDSSEQDYLVLRGLGHLAALSASEGRLRVAADLALEA